jgi:prepilin-type N-terminal cleavage/methylation domain-containing protein
MQTNPTTPSRQAGFTLAETLISIMIMGLVFSGVLLGYTRASQRAEWSGLSLAAEALCVRQMEQFRAVLWDTQSIPILDNTTNIATSNVMILDIPISGSNVVYATNTFTIQSFTNPGPSYYKMITAKTTWALNGHVFTNTLVDYRAPDQ